MWPSVSGESRGEEGRLPVESLEMSYEVVFNPNIV